MVLQTKSITARASHSDGIRVCIMRRPDAWAQFDLWIPQLAPSQQLRKRIKRGSGMWTQFSEEFAKELESNILFLDFVGHAAQHLPITLLCIEKDPYRCHRSIVAAAIARRHPGLDIQIS